jgi:subtilisin family serine protease
MCEDAGVIFVRAAGNFSHKIDKIGGVDYENYYTNKEVVADYFQPGDKIYYHRGSSPMTKNIINVGSSSNTNILSGGILKERLDSFSDRGPGCDVIAPGNSITSASSKNSGYGFNQYVWGTVNQKVFNSVALSGTSQASPQVAGVIALYLTRYPAATPENVKKWIQTTGIKNQLLSSELNNDWGNPRSLLGGPNNYLFNPFRKGYRD